MINVKSEFPSYPKNGIYFDSFTLGHVHHTVIEAMKDFIENNGNITRKSLYKRSRKATDIYLQVKTRIADLFNASIDNIAFTPNIDISWNLILHSLINHSEVINQKLVILSSLFDHHSLLAPLIFLQTKKKLTIKWIEENNKEINLQKSSKLEEGFHVLALSSISPIKGTIRDIVKLCKDAKSLDIFTVIDFSRSILSERLNLNQNGLNISIVDASMDLLGPQGISFIHFNQIDFNLENQFPGSGTIKHVKQDEVILLDSFERFEIGNVNMYGVVGLGATLDYIDKIGISTIIEHKKDINSELYSRLAELNFLKVNFQIRSSVPPTLFNFELVDINSHDAAIFLDESFNIEVRSGLLCAHPGMLQLDLDDVILISSHIYNNIDEVDNLVKSLTEVKKILS